MSEDDNDDAINNILDSTPNYVRLTYARMRPEPKSVEELDNPAEITLTFSFGEKGFGFGEVTIFSDKQGRVFLDTEHMGKKKVLQYLTMLVENAIDERDEDPDRHALYNEATGRRCSDDCKTCYPVPGVQ